MEEEKKNKYGIEETLATSLCSLLTCIEIAFRRYDEKRIAEMFRLLSTNVSISSRNLRDLCDKDKSFEKRLLKYVKEYNEKFPIDSNVESHKQNFIG